MVGSGHDIASRYDSKADCHPEFESQQRQGRLRRIMSIPLFIASRAQISALRHLDLNEGSRVQLSSRAKRSDNDASPSCSGEYKVA